MYIGFVREFSRRKYVRRSSTFSGYFDGIVYIYTSKGYRVTVTLIIMIGNSAFKSMENCLLTTTLYIVTMEICPSS